MVFSVQRTSLTRIGVVVIVILVAIAHLARSLGGTGDFPLELWQPFLYSLISTDIWTELATITGSNRMKLTHGAILGLSTTTVATNLFVSSYAGNVTSLSLTESNGTVSLAPTSYNAACGPNPSWLTLDVDRGLLFCLNEGLTSPNGSLSSFLVNRNGTLQPVKNQTTISGPVYGGQYPV
jgi:hypothetical protein